MKYSEVIQQENIKWARFLYGLYKKKKKSDRINDKTKKVIR